MRTELYQKQSLPTPNMTEVADKLGQEVIDGSKQFEQARHEYLLQAVSLTRIAEWTNDGKVRLERAREYFEELPGMEKWRWEKFLNGTAAPDMYTFDTPPDDALEAIAGAQALRCFDRIVFWYPCPDDIWMVYFSSYGKQAEGYSRKALMTADKATPMAVGVIKDHHGEEHYFPVVRWGNQLKTLDEFEQEAHKVYRQRLLALRKTWFIAVALVALLLSIGVVFTPLGAWALFISIGTPIAVGSFCYGMVNI